MEFSILRAALADQREQWRQLWGKLPSERRDVYFLPEYSLANADDGRGEALCATAYEDGAVWMYPFLKCPITPLDQAAGEDGLCDIQTAYGYGGPVVNEPGEGEAFLREAWRRLSDWCTDAGVVGEFCRFHPLLDNHRWAATGMTVREECKTVVIDLEKYPQAFWDDSFYRPHRKMIRRAEREGFLYAGLSKVTVEDLSWFFPMYTTTQEILETREETRFNKAYFETLFKEMADKLWIGVVQKSEKTVAAILVIEGDAFAHTHLMVYGGEGSAHGMSNCLYHGIALDAAERGFKALHLGGGNGNDETDSLFIFKSKLSLEHRMFRIGTRCYNSPRYEELGARWEERNGPRPDGYFLFYRT